MVARSSGAIRHLTARDLANRPGLVLEMGHSGRLRHPRILPVRDDDGGAFYRRAAAFQAFRAQAPVRFRRNHHHAGVASTLPARR
jgi:hypothetical protein